MLENQTVGLKIKRNRFLSLNQFEFVQSYQNIQKKGDCVSKDLILSYFEQTPFEIIS